MLFSVVIPTHNRLHLLRDALETIRRQSKTWEVVVFDNASTDPVAEYVRSLGDARIRYARSDCFLSVTESWNNAIERAEGDYVILLGDDDGLAPNYFSKVEQIITEFGHPDIVYSDFYQFWHAGVAPWQPAAHLVSIKHGFFFVDRQQPFKMTAEQARHAVVGSLTFRINFSFNSQTFLYRRAFLTSLRSDGPIYRSPFPDYYIANVALARSRSTIVVPEPLAVAGISKASYGFTLYNGQEQRGDELLNTKLADDLVFRDIESVLLPGPSYNTNFAVAMEYVARATQKEIGEQVDFQRYRHLQILAVLRDYCCGSPRGALWANMRGRLSAFERIWARGLRLAIYGSQWFPVVKRQVSPRLDRLASLSGFDPMARSFGRSDYRNVIDVYDALAEGRLD